METFVKIRLPDALPAIFAGLKISITLALVSAVVGEFVGGDAGFGYLLTVVNGSMDTQLLFAGIVCLTILGVAFYLLVELTERLLIPRHIIANEEGRAGRYQAHLGSIRRSSAIVNLRTGIRAACQTAFAPEPAGAHGFAMAVLAFTGESSDSAVFSRKR